MLRLVRSPRASTLRLALVSTLAGSCLALTGCNPASELEEDPALAVPDFDAIPEAPPPNPAELANRPEFDPPLGLPDYDEVPPPPMPQMPAGMQPGQMPPGMQPGQMPPGQVPAGAMPPNAPVALVPGFMPDPHVARGQTMGQADASTFGAGCSGAVPTAPNHTLTVTQPFNMLRVLVAALPDGAGQNPDLTLAVRGPDGSFRCADDSEGFNPIVQGPFAPGTYAIYVGTYQTNRALPAPYLIGFSELATTTTAQLLAGAQAPMQPN